MCFNATHRSKKVYTIVTPSKSGPSFSSAAAASPSSVAALGTAPSTSVAAVASVLEAVASEMGRTAEVGGEEDVCPSAPPMPAEVATTELAAGVMANGSHGGEAAAEGAAMESLRARAEEAEGRAARAEELATSLTAQLEEARARTSAAEEMLNQTLEYYLCSATNDGQS